ncbi:MAG: phytanoyl-CoA dioxygenase family protein [Kiloniellales bacterium]|nr:phytanoyl-CoA dioxygenase family protein [Kiloniellales bacterium]
MSAVALDDVAGSYAENGYCFPVDVFDEERAASYRRRLEQLERKIAGAKVGNKDQLNYPHVIFSFANEIVRSPSVLDAVERVLGPNILVWGSTFFIKEAGSRSYVSWHQDLRYWGLQDHEGMVSAWLALSPVTRANGCMRFFKGSHKSGLLSHKDTFDKENFLTRGQEAIVEIDEAGCVDVELRPGQMSLHHGLLLHSSRPNYSEERRIGLVINFITPQNRQVVGRKDYAALVRGEDRFRHFELVPPPEEDLAPESLHWHEKILSAQNEALYAEAAEPRAEEPQTGAG